MPYQEGRAWKIPYKMQRSQLMEDIKLQNPSFQILKEKLVNDKLLLTRGSAPLHNYFSI